MNIDLTKEEIAILDAALVEWQNAPSRDGFMSGIFGAILRRGEGRDVRAEAESEKEIALAKVRQRELQAMRLRLKLHEISGRAGEFENTPPPPANPHGMT